MVSCIVVPMLIIVIGIDFVCSLHNFYPSFPMKKICFFAAVVFLFAAAVCVTGCNPRKIPANFDYGSWTGSTYRNDFFGFSISVPKDWHIAGKEEMKALTQESQNMDFVNKEEMKKMAKIAEITTAKLFMASRYTDEEAAKKEGGNPNIAVVAENLAASGVTDRAKYVSLARQNIKQTVPGAVIKSETTKMIGGREFSSMNIELNIQGVPDSPGTFDLPEKQVRFVYLLDLA